MPPMPEDESKQPQREAGKPKSSVGFRSFRGRLVAGILIIIPLAVTGILMRAVYRVALSVGASVVNWAYPGLLWLIGADETQDSLINPTDPDWPDITMAVGLTILLLYVLGALGSNVVGRRLIDLVESLVERIPLVDTIYPAIKRMVQSLSGSGKGKDAQRVVLIDFPNNNMKAIAFMTNTLTDLNSGQRLATVYVPTTPNPTSGYMEFVPLDRITQTDWSMEEALSMILSGGATAPPNVRLRPGPRANQFTPAPDSTAADEQAPDKSPG